MWRHGALASLGVLSLASHAMALPIDAREQRSASAMVSVTFQDKGSTDNQVRAWYQPPRYTPPRIELPRYDPPRIERHRRPAPPPVFVPHYTQLETRTILDGREVMVLATLWRDEHGRWNVKVSLRGERGCELPPIYSASLAVKSDRRWWRADMANEARDARRHSYSVAAGQAWGCDRDARVFLHLMTPSGGRMIRWDGVRVD